MKKRIRIAALIGGGPAPGFSFEVQYLTLVEDEGHACLNEAEYEHMVDQVRALAREPDPTHPKTVTVEAIEDFFELKEKGGPLHKKNIRLFFMLDRRVKKNPLIVLLGLIKKEAGGQTPAAVKITMRRRRRKYMNGDYGVAS